MVSPEPDTNSLSHRSPVFWIGDHIGRFEAAEFTPSLFRAHVTARELASPPFEDVYIRACAGRVTPNQRRL